MKILYILLILLIFMGCSSVESKSKPNEVEVSYPSLSSSIQDRQYSQQEAILEEEEDDHLTEDFKRVIRITIRLSACAIISEKLGNLEDMEIFLGELHNMILQKELTEEQAAGIILKTHTSYLKKVQGLPPHKLNTLHYRFSKKYCNISTNGIRL